MRMRKPSQKLLDAYLDEELAGPKRNRVEEHIATCPDCRDYVESARRVQQALKQEMQVHQADSRLEFLWPRLETALDKARPDGKAPAWWVNLLSVLAARKKVLRLVPAFAAAAVLFLLVVQPHLRSPERSSEEVVIESVAGKNATFVVSRFKETETSIIWIVEPNG